MTEAKRTQLPDLSMLLPEPRHEPVTSLIAAWAARDPDAPALRQGDRCWSYGALTRGATTLAHALLARGLRPGDVVAIAGQRGFGVVASIVAALMGGGVFLTLDPALPPARRKAMLDLSGARLLLCVGEQGWRDMALDEAPALDIIAVDPDAERLVGPVDHPSGKTPHLPAVAPDDAAYVFFTSGTTGVPKGVVGCHKGLSHFLAWERQTCRIGPGDRVAQLTGLSFDVVLRDIFLPLTSGATLCLPETDADLSPDGVLSWLDRQEVSLLHVVPALAQVWLGSAPPGSASLRHLRWVLFAGEPLTDDLVRRWRAAFPESGAIGNLYGPTETTLAKCFYQVPDEPSPGVQPVGQPLPQTQALVMSGRDRVCDPGEVGEIVIRTPFRSKGYLNAPEEMRRRFVPNPYRDDAGDLLYHTGDRGRYQPDGTMEILGRLDHQVKVRGMRVELGEVEATLSQHPAVRQAVVVALEDVPGEKRLVAYVVLGQGQQATVGELRRYIAVRLPAPMTPAAFVILAAVPLTPNGKVDRQALPPPSAQSQLDAAYVAAATPAEELVADIWVRVLRLDHVGIHDDFFALGGHSLQATQVIARIRAACGVDLALHTFFAMPTVAGLARRLEGEGRGPAARPPLRPVPRQGAQPLSLAQQGLWFLDQLTPRSAAYNIPASLKLEGALDVGALERSLNAVVARHEVLRTTVTVQGEQPAQVIAPAMALELPLVDLSARPRAEREAHADRLAREEAERPFDLRLGPLLRATLVRLSADEHLLLLTMHHIISDAWSLGVFARELAALYAALSHGRPMSLPALPIQYADFAAWQRAWLRGAALDGQLAYWRRGLLDAPVLLELATDRPRPAVQSFRGARYSFTVDAAVRDGLLDLSRREGATLFMTLLAAFQTLLARYTGQDDIVVGSPVAGRTSIETEGLIGCFVNTLPFRTSVAGDPRFRELLARVREVALGAYAHQDVPFERLVEELRPARDPSYMPLCQVTFVLYNEPPPDAEQASLRLQPMPVETGTTKFDLTLFVRETTQGLEGAFEYSTDLFDTGTIERLAGHLQALLRGVAADPDRSVYDLPLLDDAERRQLLYDWSHAPALPSPTLSSAACVHERVAARAARVPDAVAVAYGDARLTYGELDAQANRLARYLRTLGVGPEVRVGLFLERSLDLVVGIMGILKAGGAYVPLDPAYPAERLALVVADAAMPVLMTQTALIGRLPARSARIVCLDENDDIRRESPEAPEKAATADNLAYVIYTSGSAGRPKGVLVSHRNLAHSTAARLSYYREPVGHYLLLSSHAFDSSVAGIFWTLCEGGTLWLPTAAVQQDPVELAAFVTAHDISHLLCIPSLYAHILAAARRGQFGRFGALRTVIVAGEPCPRDVVRAHHDLLPQAVLFNEYGPTEGTVWSTVYACEESSGRAHVPIGRPIAGARVYILDERRQPTPIGVPGELYVGGAGVARGYLNHPELTAERFGADPFSTSPDARLYRTGDRARYLPDGNIEFLGRLDHQVKIRGYRVELGEIEAVVSQHPAVRTSVVAVQGERLIAYVVPTEAPSAALQDEGAPALSAELRRFLKERLPEYMTPAFFVVLARLPLTSNGKVDRRALPAPDGIRPSGHDSLAGAESPMHRVLIQIWEELLGVRPIGIADNFFDLGGYSLLAVRLLDRVEQVCGKKLPLATLFAGATVEHLAQALARNEGEDAPLPLVEIQAVGDRQPFFFLHGDVYGGFYSSAIARYLGPDQPFYVLQPHGLDGGMVPETIETMAAAHIKTLRAFRPDGPYLLGGFCNGGVLAFEMARQLQAQDQRVDLLVLIAAEATKTGYAFVHPLMERYGASIGLRPRQRAAYALLLRYYLSRVNNFARLGPDQRVRTIHNVAQASMERAGEWLRRRRDHMPLGATGTMDGGATSTAEARRRKMLRVYWTAMARYVPRPYAGRVTLLWPRDDTDWRAAVHHGWGGVASELDLRHIPGTHATCTREHVRALAACVQACLREVDASDP